MVKKAVKRTLPLKRQWFNGIKPVTPLEPMAPVETNEIDEKVEVVLLGDNHYSSPMKPICLGDLTIPKCIKFSEIYLDVDQYGEGVFFYYVQKRTHTDPYFAQKVKQHKLVHDRWKEEMKQHEKDLEEWNVWSEREKTKLRDKEVAAARMTLRKHGIKA